MYDEVFGIVPKHPFVLQLWLWWRRCSTAPADEGDEAFDARDDVADPLEIPKKEINYWIEWRWGIRFNNKPEAHDEPELIEYKLADCTTFSPIVYEWAPTL